MMIDGISRILIKQICFKFVNDTYFILLSGNTMQPLCKAKDTYYEIGNTTLKYTFLSFKQWLALKCECVMECLLFSY